MPTFGGHATGQTPLAKGQPRARGSRRLEGYSARRLADEDEDGDEDGDEDEDEDDDCRPGHRMSECPPDCSPGWQTYECRDDGTLMHGNGCASCEDCEAFDHTAATGGRLTCEPGTSPIVYYYDEDLDGTPEDMGEVGECQHTDCSEAEDEDEDWEKPYDSNEDEAWYGR